MICSSSANTTYMTQYVAIAGSRLRERKDTALSRTSDEGGGADANFEYLYLTYACVGEGGA